tara:strand:- start:1942 stop:2091 length:150 start_codon:yes stop_codon:yes gene_type:complete
VDIGSIGTANKEDLQLATSCPLDNQYENRSWLQVVLRTLYRLMGSQTGT